MKRRYVTVRPRLSCSEYRIIPSIKLLVSQRSTEFSESFQYILYGSRKIHLLQMIALLTTFVSFLTDTVLNLTFSKKKKKLFLSINSSETTFRFPSFDKLQRNINARRNVFSIIKNNLTNKQYKLTLSRRIFSFCPSFPAILFVAELQV